MPVRYVAAFGSRSPYFMDSVAMKKNLRSAQGTRYALFAYNIKGKEGGYADFYDFKVEEPMAERSKNIPLGKVVTLTNITNNLQVWANPHGMMHSAGQGSKEFNGPGCYFKVHDKGKGKVALEALNGTGFLTVVGIGLAGDVRLMKEESEGSLFQWQDMLYNQCTLMSLKTNRYVGLIPETGDPYSADFPGALPNRRNGTVLTWKVFGEQ